MSEFKIGDLIVFKTHPFVREFTNIKLSAYSDYTSPIMVIKETKEKSHDKETGRDIGQQLHCTYYNSRDGKFTDKWINSNLANKLSFSALNHKILDDFDLKKELIDLKKELISKNYEKLINENHLNKKAILKSVDLELFKTKINRTKENGELAETNHLEFLPPLMTIIGFKFQDDKNKFCEKTGIPLIELKCKWYNSNTKSFSENFLSIETLYRVNDTQDILLNADLLSDIVNSIEDNSFFNLPILPVNKCFNLEGRDIRISHTLGRSEAVLYKHYFYQMNYFDYISQNKSSITIDDSFTKKNEKDVFGKKYPDYNSRGFRLKTTDCRFIIDSYYFIRYKDAYSNITKRIIKISDLFIYIKDFKKFKETYTNLNSWTVDDIAFVKYNYEDDGSIYIYLEGEIIPDNRLPKKIFTDDNVEIIVKTNCLLRKGKIRNFKINSILEIQEIIDGNFLFEDLK
ncbi:hypothetical protein K6T82_11970 [Flavobacterium sp. 17A]|uniref:Uncharacterized protein n=1 Tax=Flavobacterium potami TaxID=2872310 RepID=A0A9X1HB74_9FLAO|nr:hypothetical protein [Flavobacterium potami]MBZ4035488.1 hypothetical protein [Flavobacterium potami]